MSVRIIPYTLKGSGRVASGGGREGGCSLTKINLKGNLTLADCGFAPFPCMHAYSPPITEGRIETTFHNYMYVIEEYSRTSMCAFPNAHGCMRAGMADVTTENPIIQLYVIFRDDADEKAFNPQSFFLHPDRFLYLDYLPRYSYRVRAGLSSISNSYC